MDPARERVRFAGDERDGGGTPASNRLAAADLAFEHVLLGRAKEVATLDEVLGRVRSGHGQALVRRGEPGIGNTALLGHVAEAAERLRLLRMGGVEPESNIGHTSLDQLVRLVLGVVDQIPEPQARALQIALGRADGPVPERLLVVLATMALLAEVAVDRPVLCQVDDAQRVNRTSLAALAFAARRLDAEPVGIVFATRPDRGARRTLVGVSGLRLTELDEQSAGELLDGHDRSSLIPRERREVLALAQGNPLTSRELPDAWLPAARSPEPVPLTTRLQDAFLQQFRRHDEATRPLLLVIAAEGPGQLAVIRAAAASVGAATNPLDRGGLQDVVAHEGEQVVAVEVADWLGAVALEGDTPDAALHRLVKGGNRARMGRDPGMRPGDLDAVERLTDPMSLARAAGLTWTIGAYDRGTRLRRKAVQRARATGAAGAHACSLAHLVFEALTQSRVGAAEAHAEEGYQLAIENGQPNTACRHLSLRVWVAALQGRADEARTWAEDVITDHSRRQPGECLVYARLALGHLDLVDGAYINAVCHYEATEPRAGAPLRSGPALTRLAELIEALVRADQHDQAADLVPRFTSWTGRTASSPLPTPASPRSADPAPAPAPPSGTDGTTAPGHRPGPPHNPPDERPATIQAPATHEDHAHQPREIDPPTPTEFS